MLARGKRSYRDTGEVRRKFGQFKSSGIVSFLKKTGMFGGVTDRNCVDKQLDISLFAVSNNSLTAFLMDKSSPGSKTLIISSHLYW